MRKIIFIAISLLIMSCSVKPMQENNFPLGVHKISGVDEIRVEFTDMAKCYIEKYKDGKKVMYKCEYVIITDGDKNVYKVNFRQLIMNGCNTGKVTNIIGNDGLLFHHTQLSRADWQLDCTQAALSMINKK
ncbi:hypothetical protein MY04_4735 [Flammeovirga sp. MY04]|uniref:hypothetical protein n=1 Tax=Flammeovirga sp. MY04 TaxID=1191459 RepID=UPI000806303C|nr:hypothetical protein [Flammeovirga sp. MY04]ANQ52070.1 hypothetical protein MY04_4735 [Flammeovirga sp. MY04]